MSDVRLRLVAAALVVAGMMALALWMLWDARRTALERAILASENVAAALEQDIKRNIEIYDLSLQAAVEGMQLADISALTPEFRKLVLFDRAATARHLGAIFVLDEAGKLVIDSQSLRPQIDAQQLIPVGADLSDRDYFQVHRDSANVGLYISGPILRRFKHDWAIALSRRITRPDGSFGGVVAGTIELGYFRQLFDGIDLGPKGSVALLYNDKTLVMRKPYVEEVIGRDLRNGTVFQRYPGADRGTFELASVIDGIKRIFVFRKLTDLPLLLTVAQAEDEVYAEWRQKAVFVVLAMLGLGLVAALLSAALLRELHRRGDAERTARQSERRYRLLAEHSSDTIIVLDYETLRRLYVSPGCRRLFGYEPEEMLGEVPAAITHPDDQPLLSRTTLTLRETRNARIVYRSRHKDGHYVWIEASVTLTTNPETGALEVISNARDITERKQHEEALRAAKEEAEAARRQAEQAREIAEEASQVKSSFLANMSHEIRSPMHGIIGMLDLLDGTPLAARQKEYVGVVRESAQGLLRIINDILDISKLEAGRLELDQVDFDLEKVVRQVVDLMAAKASEKRLALRHEIAPGARGRFRGDPTRIRQILLNLVANAIKFTEQGEVAVSASGERQGDQALLRLEVKDTGIGIAEAVVGRLFTKFTQADESIARRFGGTGLGLAISKQLVEAMGGEIGVISRPGEGSCFWFTLRLALAAPGPAPLRAAPAPAAARAGEGKRVLLAEDIRVNQIIAVEMLSHAGYAVAVAGNGREAVALAEGGGFDVVLMDVHMPEMDGIEATRAIRRLQGAAGRVPVVALTADAIEGAREQYLAVGMDDFLSKPFDRASLLGVVGRWSGGRGEAAAGAAAPGSMPVLDGGTIGALAQIMSAASFEQFVEAWLAGSVAQVREIIAGAARGDWAALKRQAHNLVSTAGGVGALQLADLARRLEGACQAADDAQARALAQEIAQVAAPAHDALRAHLKKSA